MSRLAPAIALAALVIVAFFPATKAGFVWDDDAHFVEDHLMDAPDGLYRIWFEPGSSVWNYWPLSRTSFWVERRIWGVNAAASHSVNIILHLASVLILYFGLRRFGVPGAWFTAALFAVHPVFVESVTWITERKNVLSGVFYLLSAWSFLHFDKGRKWRWYPCALLFFVCALLSKSSTIMLPVILVLCRLALRREWNLRDGILLAPFFMLSLGSAAGSLWFEENVIGSTGEDFQRSWAERLAVAGCIPLFYLRNILFPYPLMFVYPRWEISGETILDFVPLAATAVIAAVLLWKKSSWGRTPALCLAAYLASLFPVLGFFDIYGMRYSFVWNHWVYLPALPVLVLVGSGADALFKNRASLGRLACGSVLAALTLSTYARNFAFENAEALWADTIEKNPECWMAHFNYGNLCLRTNRVDEAIALFQRTVEIQPSHAWAQGNLGSSFFRKGDYPRAIEAFRRALEMDPGNVRNHKNIGAALAMSGRFEEAIPHYRTALNIEPGDPDVHYYLASTLLQAERIDEAVSHYQKALALRPDFADAQWQLAEALLDGGRFEDAIPHFEAILRSQSAHMDACLNLGFAYLQSRRYREALGRFESALELRPDDPAILNSIAWILATCPEDGVRDGARAVELAAKANQLSGGRDTATLHTLAAAHAEAGDFERAKEKVRLAIEIARRNNDATLEESLEEKLRSYEAGEPFRDTGRTTQ